MSTASHILDRVLVMEHAAYHGDAMVERARAAGFDDVELHHDLSERERWIVARVS